MSRFHLLYVIKLIVLFIAFSYIVDKIVYFTLNKISDKVFTGQSVGKLNHYLQVKDNIDFVVFGSSRANHNVNPIEISNNSFNMGVDGQMIAYSATLCKLLPKNKRQIILFHIDPENAFDSDYKGEDLNSLKIKYNRIETIENEINHLNQNNPLQFFYWCIGYNGSVLGILKNYIKPKYDYTNYYGFDPILVSDTQKKMFKTILRKEKKQQCLNSFVLNPTYNLYLDQIKNYCLQNNKTLVFFTSPIFKDQCKKDNVHFNKLMNEKELLYYDFTDYYKKNNKLIYWKDKTHLSNIGALKFTDRMNKLINNLEK